MPKTERETAALESLAQRGYLPVGRAELATWKSAGGTSGMEREALLALQGRYGLEKTGTLTGETVAFLLAPRCSVPDRIGPSRLSAPIRPWEKRELGYRFLDIPDPLNGPAVRDILAQAFAVWSMASGLAFSLVTEAEDMLITFGAGHHGDDWPFDGAHGELAHAFYPDWPDGLKGDIHFDLDETWVVEGPSDSAAYDLLTVAIHEIGHAIGLPHHHSRDSIMFPNYLGPRTGISAVDRQAVQQLYP